MDFNFFKYEATGNDFILIEDFDKTFPVTSDLIQKMCTRKWGIGSDGLLLLQPSTIADVKMRIFNQDGSEASMCGNGLRCVINHFKKSLSIETKGGISLGNYSSNLIKASLPKSEIIQSPITLPYDLTGHLVNTGTPHLVIFSEIAKNHDIAKNLRYHPLFGDDGVNVNLAQITPNGTLVRTFEKGVDEETLSCGSGAAAVSLLIKKHHNIDPVKIIFPTTSLSFSFDSTQRIWMEGLSSLVFQGNIVL